MKERRVLAAPARSPARHEAAVIGAGAAGLAAALALAHKGVAVALVGPPTRRDGDRRTTALIGPSVRLLENLGVWEGSDPAPRRRPG
ncbi:MAG: FAD-dependent monooxygenase, partial [Hyphomicrobiaceae bacterium]